MMCSASNSELRPKDTTQSISEQDRKELMEMARHLRRIKRRLLLQTAAEPYQAGTDSLRDLLIRAMSEDSTLQGSSGSLSTVIEEE